MAPGTSATEEHRDELREAFKVKDRNGNGYISGRREDLRAAFKVIDRDGNGLIWAAEIN